MHCRICDHTRLIPVIDLGNQPWGNHFLSPEEKGKEPFYPLRVVYCEHCSGAQLDYTVKKEVMFSNHTYLSGMTKTLLTHFDTTASLVDTSFFEKKKNKRALDIGSNDGSQLQSYKRLGYEVLGVESSSHAARIANENNLTTLHAFFNEDTAQKIEGKFDIINASGVFFHLEELHSVTKGIKLLLDEKGVFVVQFMYMKNILDNMAFDQIYHEHLLYYTLKTISTLLARHNLTLFDAYLSPIHGGSIIAYVSHLGSYPKTERLQTLEKEELDSNVNALSSYRALAEKLASIKEKNLAYLRQKKEEGKKVFAMGAPVKGNTLLNYFGITTDLIECLVEKNPLRKGLYSPGMHIPIVLEDELESPPDVYYVLAWNFKEEILRKNRHLIEQGVEFYFPVDPQEIACGV